MVLLVVSLYAFLIVEIRKTSPEGRVSKVFVDVITQALSSSSLRTVLCLEDADFRNLRILTDRAVDNRLTNLSAV